MASSVLHGHSRAVVTRPSMETEIPKLRRLVSAIRDYPPGCGRFAARIRVNPKEDSAINEGLVYDEKVGEAKVQDLGSSSSNKTCEKNSMGQKNSSPDDIVDFAGSGDYLKKAVTRRRFCVRKVSAIRDYPPLCGPSFLRQCEKKRMLEEEERKTLKKIAESDAREVKGKVGDGDIGKGKLVDMVF